MLFGRANECARLDALMNAARGGAGGALVLRGAPGIGKTALMAYAADRADDMRVIRVRGIETESELAFAGLHQALYGFRSKLAAIPRPQADAISAAIGLTDGDQPDRFLVAAAALSILSEVAAEQPLLVLVDDLHWLDPPSAEALMFAARRLEAEPVAAVFASRDGSAETGLPSLDLEPLARDAAEALIDDGERGLTAHRRRRVLDAAQGNPLALVELGSSVTDPQTEETDGAGLHLSDELERTFFGRAGELPEPSRRVLLLAAAEDQGDLATILRAAESLGIGGDALAPAERAGLLRLNQSVLDFQHPLVRSAVYQAAAPADRREAHLAMAGALHGDANADRRAWHRALAALPPDEVAGNEIHAVAERARDRGAPAAAASAFERAAALTADSELAVRRLLGAAESAWLAGWPARALPTADAARARTTDVMARAQADYLRGTIEGRLGDLRESYVILTTGAAAIASVDNDLAVEMLAEAVFSATYAGDLAGITTAGERAGALPSCTTAGAAFDVLFLAGAAAVQQGEPERGVPMLREAMELADTLTQTPHLIRAGIAATHIGDDATAGALWTRAVLEARVRGDLGGLCFSLEFLATIELTWGRYAGALANASEGLSLAREIGAERSEARHLATLARLLAIQGREADCRQHAEEALRVASGRGVGLVVAVASSALGLLELGLGQPEQAFSRFAGMATARPGEGHPLVWLQSVADMVEAAVRSGRTAGARQALAQFEIWAPSTGVPWALGDLARCRGLVADGEAGLGEFERAIELYSAADRPFEGARAHLLLGEAMRRNRRRSDARPHLRAALEVFERLSAKPWADRAANELRASGETARRRVASAASELTPQELQIARLVADGASNKQIAAQLFISARTVDYHLRKVFAKLGLSSRSELHQIDLTG